jgi:RND family efflux transporter MFP subunit
MLAAFALAAAPSRADGFDCLMDPAEVIELGSPVTGLLESVTVDRGDKVKAGQVVARLNSDVQERTVELLRVRANAHTVIEAQQHQMAMIEKRYARVEKLHERGIATEDALDQAEVERIAAQSNLFQAQLNQQLAERELERAEAELNQRTIRSPVDGIVEERVLTGGEYVGNDDHILKIVRLDPLNVEAFFPVSLYGSIAPGDKAVVRPVAPLDGEYIATVKAINHVFDAASATFAAVLELPNPHGLLPAGHRCQLFLGNG